MTSLLSDQESSYLCYHYSPYLEAEFHPTSELFHLAFIYETISILLKTKYISVYFSEYNYRFTESAPRPIQVVCDKKMLYQRINYLEGLLPSTGLPGHSNPLGSPPPPPPPHSGPAGQN